MNKEEMMEEMAVLSLVIPEELIYRLKIAVATLKTTQKEFVADSLNATLTTAGFPKKETP